MTITRPIADLVIYKKHNFIFLVMAISAPLNYHPHSFMDNETFDIALFSTFVHGEVILPEDVGTGDTYDHVLDNFPVYLRTEDLNVHRKRWGKSKGVLFRNQAYDDEDHEHHGEVAIAMSNFLCAFGTGVGAWTR